jgi:hypothetical protein
MSQLSKKYCINWNKHLNISFVEEPVHHLVVGLFPDEVSKISFQIIKFKNMNIINRFINIMAKILFAVLLIIFSN